MSQNQPLDLSPRECEILGEILRCITAECEGEDAKGGDDREAVDHRSAKGDAAAGGVKVVDEVEGETEAAVAVVLAALWVDVVCQLK